MTNPLQAGVDHAELRRLAGVDRALAFLDSCVRAGELHPEGAENPCDVWAALSEDVGPRPFVALEKIDLLATGFIVPDCDRDDVDALLGDICEVARDALRAAPVLPDRGWRLIESAPRDGTVIDAWRNEGGRDTVFWGYPHHDCGEMGGLCDSDWHSIRAAGWVCSSFNEFLGRAHNPFTHWMPLPDAPAEGGE